MMPSLEQGITPETGQDVRPRSRSLRADPSRIGHVPVTGRDIGLKRRSCVAGQACCRNPK